MFGFVVLVYLLCITIFPIWLLDKRFEEVLPTALMASVLVLYVFGFFNALSHGVYALLGWAVCSSIYVLLRNRHELGRLARRLFTPGLLVFAVGLVFMFILFHDGRLLYEWDELTYWGPFAKETYRLGGFYNSAGSLLDAHTEIPPASILFQYLWLKLLGSFHEPHLLLSLYVLCFSLLLPALKRMQWRDALLWGPVGLLAFVLPGVIFPSYMSNIYPDALMALAFAHLMHRVLALDQSDTASYITLSLNASFLVLVKSSGVYFALVAMLSLAIRLLVANRPRFKRIKESVKDKWKYGLGYGLCVLMPVACFMSWALWTAGTNSVTQVLSPSGAYELLIGSAPQTRYDIARSFFSNLFSSTNSDARLALSYMGWLVLLFAVMFVLVLLRYRKRERAAAQSVNICMAAGGLLYALCILSLYLFGKIENAEQLPSYYRLMNTYSLAYLAFAFLGTADMFGGRLPENAVRTVVHIPAAGLVAVALSVMMPSCYQSTLALGRDESCLQRTRAQLHLNARSLMRAIDDEDKVFIILQNTHGYEYYSLRFDTMPLDINPPYYWSIGDPYPPSYDGGKANWTWAVSSDEFAEHLLQQGYDYVYLAKVDGQFIEQFGHLFDSVGIDNGSLYRVNKTGALLTLCEYQPSIRASSDVW